MNKLIDIKEALSKATPDWYDNGNEIVSKQNLRVGIGGFLKDEDNHLAANAPEWLASLIEHYEECRDDAVILRSQVKEMQKTITLAIQESKWGDPENALDKVVKILESIQGGDTK